MEFIGWPLGLVLCLLASLFGILGKICLKLSHIQHENKVVFYIGIFGIIVLNPLFTAAAYHYGSQTLLAPMGGLTVVWNTIFSPVILREQIYPLDGIGALFIFLGCILVGISGNHNNQDITLKNISANFKSPAFTVYAIVLGVVLLLLSYLAKEALLHGKTSTRCTRVSLSALAGILNGQMFFLTCVMHLITKGAEILHSFIFYICLFAALFLALSGLYLLNMALRLYEAILVIYIYESCMIFAGAISGICFFQEFSKLRQWHIFIYSLSMSFILVGIYIISRRSVEYVKIGSPRIAHAFFGASKDEEDAHKSLLP